MDRRSADITLWGSMKDHLIDLHFFSYILNMMKMTKDLTVVSPLSVPHDKFSSSVGPAGSVGGFRPSPSPPTTDGLQPVGIKRTTKPKRNCNAFENILENVMWHLLLIS